MPAQTIKRGNVIIVEMINQNKPEVTHLFQSALLKTKTVLCKKI